ncbi:sidestep protein-like protein, partial [Dinothrombium tinctorium]
MEQSNGAFSANKRAELRCESIGSRPPAKISWWKGSERLTSSKQSVSQDGNVTHSSLSLSVSVEDNGKQIYCKAENVEMKQSSIEDRITLNVFCAPEAVHNCTVRNQSINSLHLVCEAGDNGGLRQIFFLEVYNLKLQRLHLNITSVDAPEFLIRGLPANTKFTLNVYSANAKGRSASFSLTTTTLRAEQKQVKLHPNEELIDRPVIGILIGVIATIILVFFVVVLCLKLKSNTTHQSKESSNAKNSSPRLHSQCEDISVNRIDLNTGVMQDNNGYLKSSFNPAYDRHNQDKLSVDLSMKGITVPDVTYSELSLLPCHTMTSFNNRRVLASQEPCLYASIDFKVGKCAVKEVGAFEELKHRDSPVADGCSETEVSIETPLIESLRPGGRSHDIITVIAEHSENSDTSLNTRYNNAHWRIGKLFQHSYS